MPRNLKQSSETLQLFPALLFTAILVGGCGGGGGSDSSTAPVTSTFTAGPIKGFGSIIVNGTRFDVSGASVADDDDEVCGEDDLKLGMAVEVEAGEITTDSTGSHARANKIHFRSAIIGPVDAINTSTRLLIVLGQTIDVLDTTVFDERFENGPFSISVGDVLEIFGMLDTATGHYVATRIAPKPDASFFKLRGVVTDLDGRARTLVIGGEKISFANLSRGQIPDDLANGLLVTATLRTSHVNGAWIAVKLKNRVHHNDEDKDKDKDKHRGFELHGAIEKLDTIANTFVLRGIPISYSGDVEFEDGSERDLARGRRIEVEGTLSKNGTMLEATKIEFED